MNVYIHIAVPNWLKALVYIGGIVIGLIIPLAIFILIYDYCREANKGTTNEKLHEVTLCMKLSYDSKYLWLLPNAANNEHFTVLQSTSSMHLKVFCAMQGNIVICIYMSLTQVNNFPWLLFQIECLWLPPLEVCICYCRYKYLPRGNGGRAHLWHSKWPCQCWEVWARHQWKHSVWCLLWSTDHTKPCIWAGTNVTGKLYCRGTCIITWLCTLQLVQRIKVQCCNT